MEHHETSWPEAFESVIGIIVLGAVIIVFMMIMG